MTNATETAAWGIDFSPDLLTHQVRFVAVPREGVSSEELLKKFETLKVADEELGEAVSADGSLMEQAFFDQFKKTQAIIVPSKQRNGKTTKGYLFIEGEYKFDLLKIMSGQFERQFTD